MNENTIQYDKQVEFQGNAYLDPKQMPVATHADLENISLSKISEGMTVKVLSDETMDGDPVEYTRKNGQWVISSLTSEITV